MGVKKKFAKKNFAKKIMYQAKSGVKNFPLFWGRGGQGRGPEKVAQSELKHILVLEFLRSDDLGGGGSLCEIQTNEQKTRHTP